MNNILLPAMVALLFASCGNKTESAGSAVDSADVEQVNVGKSEPAIDFVHPDAQMFDLRGRVKNMVFTTYTCDEDGNPSDNEGWERYNLYFKENGEFDTSNPDFQWRLAGIRLKRDSNLHVTSAVWNIPEYSMDIEDTYTYYPNGMVKSCKTGGVESDGHTQYTYEGEYTLVSAVDDSFGEGYVFHVEMAYTILDTDEHGNWTRRLVKNSRKEGPDDGSGVYTDSSIDYELEIRAISYYK